MLLPTLSKEKRNWRVRYDLDMFLRHESFLVWHIKIFSLTLHLRYKRHQSISVRPVLIQSQSSEMERNGTSPDGGIGRRVGLKHQWG